MEMQWKKKWKLGVLRVRYACNKTRALSVIVTIKAYRTLPGYSLGFSYLGLGEVYC